MRTILPWILMAAAWRADATANLVRDWGLHRQWRVERDPVHPERPARLVEVPWSTEEVSEAPAAALRAARKAPEVRAGMPVTVIGESSRAEIRLRGTALGTARCGETVAVRAGLGAQLMHGVVRGAGLVELLAEKSQ